jgi:hypothetical protein
MRSLIFFLLPFLTGCYSVRVMHEPALHDYDWMIMQEQNIVQPPSGLEEKCDLDF